MFEYDELWIDRIPTGLVPAVEHLRNSFEDFHERCGETTRAFCYAALHEEPLVDPRNEHKIRLTAIREHVGRARSDHFMRLFRRGTAPAIFKAFYDLYLEAVGVEALGIYGQCAAIGLANKDHIGVPHLKWAREQTQNMIREHRYRIRVWVRGACDKQVYDPGDDGDELAFWTKWQAPTLIVMEPSQKREHDPLAIWTRATSEISSRWLDVFADDYVLHLEGRLSQTAGEAALVLAKQTKRPLDIPLATPVVGLPVTPEGSRYSSVISLSAKEKRKAATKHLHERMRALYEESIASDGERTIRERARIIKERGGFSQTAETIKKILLTKKG